jgi:GntR family transcriptional regulator, arabinose operon transcriptional repressor
MNLTKLSISQNSITPLHVQICNQIRHFILSGQWEPGRRLPSELELQKELGLSRSTIRQALKGIESEGLIIRVPGRGSFVKSFLIEKTKSRVIGYVTLEFSNDFQYQLFRGAESAVRSKGYRLLFCHSNKMLSEENTILDELLADRVNGIIIYPALSGGKQRRLFQLAHQNMTRIVLMDRMIEGLSFDFVSTDNFKGAYEAVQYLAGLGHKKIVFLTNPILSSFPITERLKGYQQAMIDSELEPMDPWLVGHQNQEMWWDYVIDNFKTVYKYEMEQIKNLLMSKDRPTAIFTMNQVIAILSLKAAFSIGLKIPDDLSILSFDESDIIYNMELPLTSVYQYTYYMGKRAAELLIERIEGYQGPQRKEFIPAQLQIRASTGRPPV